LHLYSASTSNNRGNWLDNILTRDCSENGVFIENSSDNYLHSIHTGTTGNSGIRIDGGNNYITNSSTTYSDTYGFYLASGRHALSACKVQDNATGIYMGASTTTMAGVIVDTSSADGLVVAASDFSATGLIVMLRTSGRYSTQTNGIRFSGSRTGLTMIGNVIPSNITNPISGTTPTQSFIRINNGATLYSVG